MNKKLAVFALTAVCGATLHAADSTVVLFEDGFGSMRSGAIGSEVGAQLDYHYLPKVNSEGAWAISTFSSSAPSQRAWRIGRYDGQPVLLQMCENKLTHTRPTIVAGDDLWADYTLAARFTPETRKGRSGVSFRHHNDRCYYFCGVQDSKAVLKLVRHEKDFRIPAEKLLAESEFGWKPGGEVGVEVSVTGNRIEARLNGKTTLTAGDDTFKHGRIVVTDATAYLNTGGELAGFARARYLEIAKRLAQIQRPQALSGTFHARQRPPNR